MNLQLIRYYGQIVAVAGEQRFWLSHRFARRAAGDPERAWIIYMCAYARDVLCGELLGPYTDGNARVYARAALIPDTFARRAAGDPERAWIIYMCAYARDVLCGELPGPYTDGNARLYARAALIPDRLIDSATVDVPGAARAFGIPAHELGAARREWWDRLSP